MPALFFSVLLTALFIAAPLSAKGPTLKIIVKGADLRKPVEITDPNVLAPFNIWTGPGTSSNEQQGLIIDWSGGVVSERPKGLRRYEVSFYSNHHADGLDYVVYYEYDPTTKQGYVYVPGESDEWYRMNTFSIYHGIEGNWFHAWTEWNNIATPLIHRNVE
jgi:hypothetical protein